MLRFKIGRFIAWLWRFQTLFLARRLFRGVTGPCIVRRRFYGFNLYLDAARTDAQRVLYLEGERFVEERHVLAGLLKPGMRVIDVGANIGYYLLLFRRAVGKSGAIICVEPDADNLRELRMNLSRNGLKNTRIVEAAAGEAEGVVHLAAGLNSMVSEQGTVEVPLKPLDSLTDQRVDFIKIDVEGYEGHVLHGAQRIMTAFHPTLFVEMHPNLLTPHYSLDEILLFLRRHYANILFYDTTHTAKLATIKRRYFGGDSIQPADPGKILADCEQGRQTTFWIVCRQQDANS